MANPNPTYPAPTWANDSPPALSAENMQDISDAILALQREGFGRSQITLRAEDWIPSRNECFQRVSSPSNVTLNSIFAITSTSAARILSESGAIGYGVENAYNSYYRDHLIITVYGGIPREDIELYIFSVA